MVEIAELIGLVVKYLKVLNVIMLLVRKNECSGKCTVTMKENAFEMQ